MNQTKIKTFTLLNLGGPRNENEIEKFLLDLFLDPYVFDLPLWEPIRKLLAIFIAKTRTKKVKKTYASMGYGGGSPLFDETNKQLIGIKEVLDQMTGDNWSGNILMACGAPNIKDFVNKSNKPNKDNIHLALYPQFSRSTVLSTASIYQSLTGVCPMSNEGWIEPFGLDSRFINITSQFIYDYFTNNLNEMDYPHFDSPNSILNWQNVDLVFSAHGIPMRLIDKGDMYVIQLNEMIENILTKLRSLGFYGSHHLSFQSRVGRAKWTEPNTKDVLRELGGKRKNIVVYPISFVGDHLETLEEIGVELKEIALKAGAGSYHRIPALGIYPPFIEFLAKLILESHEGKVYNVCLCKKYGGEKLAGCHLD
ncbi:MAG: ferrochelatase [Leptospira sp.]|nr:ferrochelatase [Leptospira sp.]